MGNAWIRGVGATRGLVGVVVAPFAVSIAAAACSPRGPAPTYASDETWFAEPESAVAAEARDEGPFAETLRRVARSRGLDVLQPVAARRVSRRDALRHVRAKAARDVPPEVMLAQGELLRSLGVVPRNYDYLAGVYALLADNLAGFYDQDEDALFLVDDLRGASVHETIVHELVHALQDQHFDLNRMLRFRAGQSDRTAAAHALCEGDATAATMSVVAGSAVRLSADELQGMMLHSVAERSSAPPEVLQRSLVMPYIDGLRFVQALYERGGWPEVDAAYRRLPRSTEQLLHLEKYDENELPETVRPPPVPDGFVVIDRDTLGEQALRILLDQWSPGRAPEAASGWRGDQYVVVRRRRGDEVAFGFGIHIRMEREADAEELVAAVAEPGTGALTLPAPDAGGVEADVRACRERADLGPLALVRRGSAVALVAGPYLRTPALRSASRCDDGLAWAEKSLDPWGEADETSSR
ncbi:MAG: hypothetical protein AAF928_02920 [Myxococcota bacterium]